MRSRTRELEALLLAMYAAVPLYLTRAIGVVPLVVFHAVMGAIALRVASGRGPDLLPARAMRWLAIAYVPFYILDAAVISRGAIAASTHLVLFIAAYQPVESIQRENHAQRLLTSTLIFVASLATSTHITIVFFVIGFAFFTFRQLMTISHAETARALGRTYDEAPSGRAAGFYLAGAALAGALLFPLLPRVRNPFVQGITGNLQGATTGLSETIDFREPRTSTADSTVVARIWMSDQAAAFFAPVRLRGTVYDRFRQGEWQQTFRGLRPVLPRGGRFNVARRRGAVQSAIVQLRPQKGKLFLPVGTYSIAGLSNVYEGPTRESYYTYQPGSLRLDVDMAYSPEPLRAVHVTTTGYPVSPEIEALARRIVGKETRPEPQAELIESYMTRNFRYVANPADLGKPMSVDQFLLRTHAGHCEYFAAGMVTLMTALDVPARIAGGFYGGRRNPLTGYYTIRREDAHAWTEVWNGERWLTYDSTPPALRPGSADEGALRSYLAAIGDSVTFFWDRYVLTFGLSDQIALFSDAITWLRDAMTSGRAQVASAASSLRRVLPLVIAASALLAMLGAWIARRRRGLFDVVATALAQRGVKIDAAMTAEDALRALRERDQEAAEELAPLIAIYEQEQFGAHRTRTRRRDLLHRFATLPR
ncbi:MAG TPA: transglutaminaseTgpA domain-containing protein [Thermoanaerobaculia bacterium]|jgi:transglutaminase-like putative cysteine protease